MPPSGFRRVTVEMILKLIAHAYGDWCGRFGDSRNPWEYLPQKGVIARLPNDFDLEIIKLKNTWTASISPITDYCVIRGERWEQHFTYYQSYHLSHLRDPDYEWDWESERKYAEVGEFIGDADRCHRDQIRAMLIL